MHKDGGEINRLRLNESGIIFKIKEATMAIKDMIVNPKKDNRSTPISYDRPFDRLQMEFDRMFRGFLDENERFPFSLMMRDSGRKFFPRLNISENDQAIEVTAEMPGLDEKDIKITLKDDLLTLCGEKKEEQEEKDKSYHRVERSYGCFERTVRLPMAVEVDKVKATYQKGILSIHLPKSAAALEQVRRIEVSEQ